MIKVLLLVFVLNSDNTSVTVLQQPFETFTACTLEADKLRQAIVDRQGHAGNIRFMCNEITFEKGAPA